MLALAVGVAVVVCYLFFFYRGLGLLTLGSLAVFAVLYLGLLATLSHFGLFALSLPGLAGIVLTTGSAADSSILELERFREEIRMGRTVRNASVSGTSHGIRTPLTPTSLPSSRRSRCWWSPRRRGGLWASPWPSAWSATW